MSIVKDTGLSSTHVSREPWGHSWFFTVKTVLTNLRIFSHVYLPFYTTKVYYWSLPLCCVHQNTSSNVTMTSCLLTVGYLSYRHSSVIVSEYSPFRSVFVAYAWWDKPQLLMLLSTPSRQVWALCATEVAKYFDFQVHSVSVWDKVKMSS